MFRIFSESREAIREHQHAKADLEHVSRRDQHETPAYDAANQRVIDTEPRVSSFRR